MRFNKFRTLVYLLIVILLSYILHKAATQFFPSIFSTTNFIYSLEELYGFFSICSVAIVVLVIFVNTKNKDNVGMSFIIFTTIKILFCVLAAHPILHNTSDLRLEKINFFMIFLLFLAIETILTIRILNNKQ